EAVYFAQRELSFVVAQTPLMVTDGTTGGTHAVASFPFSPVTSVYWIRTAGAIVYAAFFGPHTKLWAVTPGDPNPRPIFDGGPPARWGFIDEPTPFRDRLLFVAGDVDAGIELWVTDGTSAGTRRVADLAPGRASSGPADLTVLGDRVFFSADDGV